LVDESLASTLFSYRYVRQASLRVIADIEQSCRLMSTQLQQSITLLSGNWKLLSDFYQQLPYFFYSYTFSGYRIHIWRYRIQIKIFSHYINHTSF